jgi:hypothetical protein
MTGSLILTLLIATRGKDTCSIYEAALLSRLAIVSVLSLTVLRKLLEIHKSLESEQGDLVYMRLLNEFIVTNVSGIVSAGWSHLPFYLAGIKRRFIKPIDAQLFRFWICCPS